MASDLRTQFLNYMTVQRFSHHTKRSYVTGVKLLAKYYMQSPDTLTNDQIQDSAICSKIANCLGAPATLICPALSAFTGIFVNGTIPSFISRPGPVLKNCRLFLASRK